MYLNCHSYHSLRYGTIPLTELVQLAAACGVTMALTDINTVTGIYDFIKECQSCYYKPIIGIEFDTTTALHWLAKNASRSCRNESFSTKHNFDKTPYPLKHQNFITVPHPIENAPDVLEILDGMRPEQPLRYFMPNGKVK
jgi:DNA polymerase-3 subunit alpha/error-prone DNA polymerase